MDAIVGTENDPYCFDNAFLKSLVAEDPPKDDSKSTSNHGNSNRQPVSMVTVPIASVPMTTSMQTNPTSSSNSLGVNTLAPSNKRERQLDLSEAMTQEEFLSGYGQTKKPKSADENLNQNSPASRANINLPSPTTHQNYNSTPREEYKHELENYLTSVTSNSLLTGFCQNPMPKTPLAPTIGFIGNGDLNSNSELCIKSSPSAVGLDCNHGVNNSTSSFPSSTEGIHNSPFSLSPFSDEDIFNGLPKDSSRNVNAKHVSFTTYQPVPQPVNLNNQTLPLEVNQFEGAAEQTVLDSELNPFLTPKIIFTPPPPIVPKSSNTNDFQKPFVSRSSSDKLNTRSLITSVRTVNAYCKVTNPRREYDKNQKKLLWPRRSEQRVQVGKVKMKIWTKVPLGDPLPVKIFVRREPSAAMKQCKEHPDLFTMEMTRLPDILLRKSEESPASNYSFTYNCEFDLDSVYLTADGKEVYKLVKTKGATNNRFQIFVYLTYNNGFEESLMPYEFILKSGRTPTQDPNKERLNLGPGDTPDGPRSHVVSCRYLNAETAKITNIHCENIQTENHDIAYYMRVRSNGDDVPSDMEKGDVVAFLDDEEGDTYIDFLTSENAHKARLAGVISRTAFFRGRTAICDPDHLDSDLVCIIGEVDVKVVGKVQAGDLIYTSGCEQYRGSAIARNPLESEIDPDAKPDDPTPTLLGMATESNSDLDIKFVRCLVSIVLGISDLHQRRTLEELRNCHDKIVKIQRYLKGIWKKSLLFLMFFLVAGIMCYLFLAPNSPYLISKCEKGCRERKGSCRYQKFEYFPQEAQESDEIVGICFYWNKIRRKLDLNFNKLPNDTNYRYYLNKNRCVTGGIRTISSWLDPSPRVPRVNVLAVSWNCSHVFYYSASKGCWQKYNDNQIKVLKCDR